MDTFPMVKRKDEAKHGGIYRTKETILQIYDALQESIRQRLALPNSSRPAPRRSRLLPPAA
jgi:hypothetical protein